MVAAGAEALRSAPADAPERARERIRARRGWRRRGLLRLGELLLLLHGLRAVLVELLAHGLALRLRRQGDRLLRGLVPARDVAREVAEQRQVPVRVLARLVGRDDLLRRGGAARVVEEDVRVDELRGIRGVWLPLVDLEVLAPGVDRVSEGGVGVRADRYLSGLRVLAYAGLSLLVLGGRQLQQRRG